VVDPRVTKELSGPAVPVRRKLPIRQHATGPTVFEHGEGRIDPSYSAMVSGWFQIGGDPLSVRWGRVPGNRGIGYAQRNEVRGSAADDGIVRAVHIGLGHGNPVERLACLRHTSRAQRSPMPGRGGCWHVRPVPMPGRRLTGAFALGLRVTWGPC
jgi:hypothetical protein